MFGGKNSETMLAELSSNLHALKSEKDILIDWQLYNGATDDPLIIGIITPLMKRVHTMVTSIYYFIKMTYPTFNNWLSLCSYFVLNPYVE